MNTMTGLKTLDAMRATPGDNVGVALRDLTAGERVDVAGAPVELAEATDKGHKFALEPIAQGAIVLKYGWPIGRATRAIGVGEWVHSHNLETTLSGLATYTYTPTPAAPAPPPASATFMGYRRADGRVGTRNEIWVIATVGCVANVCEKIARLARSEFTGEVDGITAITHPFGCSQLGDDLSATRRILATLAGHPNVGGVLFVGLGCESNQLDALLDSAPWLDRSRIRSVRSQSVENEIEAGLEAIGELVTIAANDAREACPLSGLVIGLKCGGSDGFSGLTANPLLGRLTDRVTAAGGSAILTEIPEIFGAEQLLMSRAASRDVFDALASVVNDFKQYFIDHDQPVYENPSPGNRDGGITTLEEKSLGAVQKGGSAPLVDVIRYGERQTLPGLTLLEAPGNDAVSSTALAAAGANLILFTTGRGTPLGFPVPTLKISSNSALAARKPGWIDFNAGGLVQGRSPQQTDEAFLACVLDIASGTTACNENNDERSIAIWKRGVTL